MISLCVRKKKMAQLGGKFSKLSGTFLELVQVRAPSTVPGAEGLSGFLISCLLVDQDGAVCKGR
jgi:hypothetical protein